MSNVRPIVDGQPAPTWESERIHRYEAMFSSLLQEEIQQFADYDGVCDLCQTPFYGILDEGLLKVPLVGFIPALLRNRGGSFTVNHNGQVTLSTYRIMTSVYELRQDIARSGLFTRSQLSSTGIFNEHELEVSERAFTSVRPSRCDCNFGSEPELNEEELLILAEFGASERVDGFSAVDSRFIAGETVRTGFRRRSREAIRRRRCRKRRGTESGTMVRAIVPDSVPKEHPLAQVNPEPFLIKFKYRPRLSRDTVSKRRLTKAQRFRKPWHGRRRAETLVYPEEFPAPHKTKYCYFVRKRGCYHLSQHHPFPDEVGLSQDGPCG